MKQVKDENFETKDGSSILMSIKNKIEDSDSSITQGILKLFRNNRHDLEKVVKNAASIGKIEALDNKFSMDGLNQKLKGEFLVIPKEKTYVSIDYKPDLFVDLTPPIHKSSEYQQELFKTKLDLTGLKSVGDFFDNAFDKNHAPSSVAIDKIKNFPKMK